MIAHAMALSIVTFIALIMVLACVMMLAVYPNYVVIQFLLLAQVITGFHHNTEH